MCAHTAAASLLAIAASACGGLATNVDGGAEDGSSTDSTLMDQLVNAHYGGPPPMDASIDIGSVSDGANPDTSRLADATCDSASCQFRCCGDLCCSPAPPYGAPFPPDSDVP